MLECAAVAVKKGATLPNVEAVQPSRWPEWIEYFRQFDSYFILFAVAAVTTAVATPFYILIARRLNIVDRPYGRKRHERATATMGGLVVFATVFAGAFFAMRLNNLVGDMLRANARYVYGLITCTACMLLLGIIDDRHGVKPKVKLLVQGVVALGAIYLGFQVEAVTLPWYESIVLPPAVGIVISLLWIVGITNAINLSDGLDGLAAGICLLAAVVNAVVAIYLGNHYMTVMMVLLAGSLLGFLRWNFHPARVFLGDTGSLALGMFLALASLHSAQKAHTVVLILIPLFALGYPIFDTLLAIARRMVRGQPLFVSDRDHIHHRLLRRGGSPSKAAILIYIASLLVSLLCLAAMTANYRALGVGLALVLVMVFFSARVLGYLEWGGWSARWSGRDETRVLHAAATLARLKINGAESDEDLVRAIATMAPEVGCVEIVLRRDGETRWRDQFRAASDSGKPGETLEMAIGDEASLQLTFDTSETFDSERRELLEDLGAEIGERIAELHGPHDEG